MNECVGDIPIECYDLNSKVVCEGGGVSQEVMVKRLLRGDCGEDKYHNNSVEGIKDALMLPHPHSRVQSCLFPFAVMQYFPYTEHQSLRSSSCGTKRHYDTASGRSRSGVKGGVPPADTPKSVSNKHTCASTTTATTTDGVVVTLHPRQPPSPPRLLTTTTTIHRILYVLLTALLLVVVQLPRVSCHMAKRKPAPTREKRELINDETVSAFYYYMLVVVVFIVLSDG